MVADIPVPRMTNVGYSFNPSDRKAGFSKNSYLSGHFSMLKSEPTWNCQISRSVPQLGRSGIMCATILYPASFDMWNDSDTARTVCPRFVSLATSCLSAMTVTRGTSSLPRIHSVHQSRASYIHIAAFDYMSAWLAHTLANAYLRCGFKQ